MKLKKFTAAIASLAMLGSLAVVPVSVSATDAPEGGKYFAFDGEQYDVIDAGNAYGTKPSAGVISDKSPVYVDDIERGNVLDMSAGDYGIDTGYDLPVGSYTVSFWAKPTAFVQNVTATVCLDANTYDETTNEKIDPESWTWITTYGQYNEYKVQYRPDGTIASANAWSLKKDNTVLNKWNMFTVTYNVTNENEGTLTLYFNGEKVTGATNCNPTDVKKLARDADVLVGMNPWSGWDGVFKGYVDDLYVYEKALEDADVATLYEVGKEIVKPADKAEKLTVSFKDGDNVVDTKTIEVTDKYVGDTYEYYFPAYVVGNDEKLYETKAGSKAWGRDYFATYNKIATLDAVDSTDTIECSPVDALAYQYKEFDGAEQSSTDTTRKAMYSNGEVSQFGNTTKELLTVEQDGVYTVKIVTSGNTWADGKEIKAGEKLIGTANYYSTAQKAEYKNVTLKANDVITLQGADRYSAVDYILIIKTGDFTDASAEIDEVESYDNGYEGAATAITFKAFAKRINGVAQAFESVAVTVEGANEGTLKKTADELGEISGDAVFGILLKNVALDRAAVGEKVTIAVE
ncbi:MAG: LamG domain-containing protein [Oscillospiraceae bacterium]|nr:LamG domain-containing protein [Oscillospiraceae bacterium]